MVKKNDATRWISAGIGSSATPSAEVNNSGCWLTYAMSARRVSAQNPGSSIGNSDGIGRCQLSPSPARSCAKVRRDREGLAPEVV